MVQDKFAGMKKFQPQPGTSGQQQQKQNSLRDVCRIRSKTELQELIEGGQNQNPKRSQIAVNTISSIKASERQHHNQDRRSLRSEDMMGGAPSGNKVTTKAPSHDDQPRAPGVAPLPRSGPSGYENWSLRRIYSEKLYSAVENISDAVSLKKLTGQILESLQITDLTGFAVNVGVEITTIHDLFKFGETGARLEMLGKVMSEPGDDYQREIALTANYNLAELLKKVVEVGDILVISGEEHLKAADVIHLNIKMTGEVSLVHYKHKAVFHPNDDNVEDSSYAEDLGLQIDAREISKTEHMLLVHPAGFVSTHTEAQRQLPGPSNSQPEKSKPDSTNGQEISQVLIVQDHEMELDDSQLMIVFLEDSHGSEKEMSHSNIQAPAVRNIAKGLSADVFEQSITPCSGQIDRNQDHLTPNPHKELPDSGSSTDEVMKALFPEDYEYPKNRTTITPKDSDKEIAGPSPPVSRSTPTVEDDEVLEYSATIALLDTPPKKKKSASSAEMVQDNSKSNTKAGSSPLKTTHSTSKDDGQEGEDVFVDAKESLHSSSDTDSLLLFLATDTPDQDFENTDRSNDTVTIIAPADGSVPNSLPSSSSDKEHCGFLFSDDKSTQYFDENGNSKGPETLTTDPEQSSNPSTDAPANKTRQGQRRKNPPRKIRKLKKRS